MDEMIRYIFGSLRNTETMHRVICKSMKRQQSINFRVTFWMTMATTYMVLNEIENRKIWLQRVELLSCAGGLVLAHMVFVYKACLGACWKNL